MSKYNEYWRATCASMKKPKPVPMPQTDRPIDIAIKTFVRDYCLFNNAAWIDAGQLYQAHQLYCKKYNWWPMTKTLFTQRLKAFYPQIKKIRKRVDGKLCYIYKGICLVP
jgi:hypothetical protein